MHDRIQYYDNDNDNTDSTNDGNTGEYQRCSAGPAGAMRSLAVPRASLALCARLRREAH